MKLRKITEEMFSEEEFELEGYSYGIDGDDVSGSVDGDDSSSHTTVDGDDAPAYTTVDGDDVSGGSVDSDY